MESAEVDHSAVQSGYRI